MKWILILSFLVSCNALKTLTNSETEIPKDFSNEFCYGCNSDSLSDSLLLFYKFNNVTPTVYDHLNTFNLSDVSATQASLVSGIRGTAANCDVATGGASGIFYSSGPTLNFSASGNYAFSFHLYKNSKFQPALSGYPYYLSGGGNSSGIRIGDIDGSDDTDDIRFQLGANHYNWYNVVPDSGWHHYAFNIQNGGTDVDLYIDGSYYGTQSSSPLGTDGSIVNICTDSGGSLKVEGTLDSFGAWNRLLTISEINLLSTANTHLD